MIVKQINKYYVEINEQMYIFEYIGQKKDLIKRIEDDIEIDGQFRINRFMTKAIKDEIFIIITKR